MTDTVWLIWSKLKHIKLFYSIENIIFHLSVEILSCCSCIFNRNGWTIIFNFSTFFNFDYCCIQMWHCFFFSFSFSLSSNNVSWRWSAFIITVLSSTGTVDFISIIFRRDNCPIMKGYFIKIRTTTTFSTWISLNKLTDREYYRLYCTLNPQSAFFLSHWFLSAWSWQSPNALFQPVIQNMGLACFNDRVR